MVLLYIHQWICEQNMSPWLLNSSKIEAESKSELILAADCKMYFVNNVKDLQLWVTQRRLWKKGMVSANRPCYF